MVILPKSSGNPPGERWSGLGLELGWAGAHTQASVSPVTGMNKPPPTFLRDQASKATVRRRCFYRRSRIVFRIQYSCSKLAFDTQPRRPRLPVRFENCTLVLFAWVRCNGNEQIGMTAVTFISISNYESGHHVTLGEERKIASYLNTQNVYSPLRLGTKSSRNRQADDASKGLKHL